MRMTRGSGARKRTEEDLLRTRHKLRALSKHQIQLIEEERKRIAREVHDDMGQKLTALQLGLSSIADSHAQDVQLVERLATLQAVVDEAIDFVRHLSTRLRPPVLDLGFFPAIEWLVEDFRQRWEIESLIEAKGEDVIFALPIAATLFRVVQESLNNIAKHAGARQVTIALNNTGARLELTICDDGRGFDPAVVRQQPGFGLLGMRERVLALGGSVYIKSAPGEGTRVLIEVPLPSGAA